MRVAQRADVRQVEQRAHQRALGDQIHDVALGAPQGLDGDGDVVLCAVFLRDGEIARDLPPRLVLRPALGHAARRAAAEHDHLHAHFVRAGKRLLEIGADNALVHVGAGDLHAPRQHTVAGLRADGGGLQDVALARVFLIGEILQPRQTHFDKVEAQLTDQLGVFGLGADAQTNHRFSPPEKSGASRLEPAPCRIGVYLALLP